MNKFLIFRKTDEGYAEKMGSYEALAKDDTSANRSFLQAEPMASHFELAEGQDEDVVRPVLVDGQYILDLDESLINAQLAKQKQDQVVAAYNLMNTEVYAEMANVFGTSNPESATAFERTWSIMKSSPASFVNVGIKDDLGVVFTLAEQVEAYADTKLAAVLAYGVWRMQRIEQFRTEKATILGE